MEFERIQKLDSVLSEMIKYINTRIDRGNLYVFRSDMIDAICGSYTYKTSAIDKNRRLFQKCEFIEYNYDGCYKLIKKIPEDITSTQLMLRAYPDKCKVNKSGTNLRPEWKEWWIRHTLSKFEYLTDEQIHKAIIDENFYNTILNNEKLGTKFGI